jgi:hypothetical protein
VECVDEDAAGVNHVFHEKAAVSVEPITRDSEFPREGWLRGIIAGWYDVAGNLQPVSTRVPDDVESLDGETLFLLSPDQFVRDGDKVKL